MQQLTPLRLGSYAAPAVSLFFGSGPYPEKVGQLHSKL